MVSQSYLDLKRGAMAAVIRFGWRKHPERIDLGVVKSALSDARKEHWLVNNGRTEGWMMAPGGMKLVLRLGQAWSAEDHARTGSVRGALESEQRRMLRSSAATKYHAGSQAEITKTDFERFARVNEYFPPQVRRERFSVIENAVEGVEELRVVWLLLKDQFRDEFE
jgi:hypothetical protein|tara:strand:- start:1802 stop:2299 length:498 start_codon:yes stop_codon:yes gene_type:complete